VYKEIHGNPTIILPQDLMEIILNINQRI